MSRSLHSHTGCDHCHDDPARASSQLLPLLVLLIACASRASSAFAIPETALPEQGAQVSAAAQAPSAPAEVQSALATITRAFRLQKASEIVELLPIDGKVYLSMTSFGVRAGYFGRGQVFFLFERIFTSHETIRFSVQVKKTHTDDAENGPVVAWSLGVWSYRRVDQLDGESQIHFALSCAKGNCRLMEIREAR